MVRNNKCIISKRKKYFLLSIQKWFFYKDESFPAALSFSFPRNWLRFAISLWSEASLTDLIFTVFLDRETLRPSTIATLRIASIERATLLDSEFFSCDGDDAIEDRGLLGCAWNSGILYRNRRKRGDWRNTEVQVQPSSSTFYFDKDIFDLCQSTDDEE